MAETRLNYRVSAAEAGRRLDEFLRAKLSAELDPSGKLELSKTKVRGLIMRGAVLLSMRPARNAALVLMPKARVTVTVDLSLLTVDKKPDDIEWTPEPERILYEDEWLLIVDKPAGLPTDPTVVTSRDSVYAALRRYLAERDGPASGAPEAHGGSGPEPYLALPHRLDRETSGVLLFVKDPEANAAVFGLFAERRVHKTYEVLCQRGARPMPETWTVDNRLSRLSPQSARAKWGSAESGGETATTQFSLLKAGRLGLHAEARPLTGRTHQIRVHLAEAGWPILGDGLYGGRPSLGDYRIPRVMLHAKSLEFPHPVTGKTVFASARRPVDFQETLGRIG